MIIWETERSRSALIRICHAVSRLKVDHCIDVSIYDLRDIATHEHNGAQFTAPDRVLGNIMGSSYTHSYRWSHDGLTCTFYRHENTGERRSIDPDRRSYL